MKKKYVRERKKNREQEMEKERKLICLFGFLFKVS